MAAKDKDKGFDQAKLQGMQEPLTVRVEKLRGNVRQPIGLPAKGDETSGFYPPGTGWTRAEVLGLENFILTKWSGGGYYEFTITDAKGDRMIWSGVWDPRVYPEKIPPDTAEAAYVGTVPSSSSMAGPQPVPMSAQPLGTTPVSGWPANFAAGYNNPPHTGPMMPSQPPASAPAMMSTPTGPQVWNGSVGPWAGPVGWPNVPSYPMPGYGPYGAPGYGPYGAPGFGPQSGFGPPSYSRRPYDDDRRERERTRDEEDRREAERREADRQRAELQEQLRRAELSQKESVYKAELERLQQAQAAQLQQISQQQSTQLQQMQQQHAAALQALQIELRQVAESRGKGEDDEVRRMREEQQRQREAAQAAERALERQLADQRFTQMQQAHEAQLAQMRQANEAQILALRDQLTRMNETPRGESDDVRRLREEQAALRQATERQAQENVHRLEMERLDRDRERERADRERRDEVMQREMQASREAMERRLEQLNNRGTDPVIDALREQARTGTENMRELARMNQQTTDRMAQFMVAPAQLATIMRDNSNGADQMMRQIVDTVGGIGNLYKNAAETIMQMSGGGGDPPAARLVQEAIGRASDVADKFIQARRDVGISDGRVKQAQAQAEAIRVQAERDVRVAQAGGLGQAPRWAPPPPVTGSGLGGTGTAASPRPPVPPSNGHASGSAPATTPPTTSTSTAPPIDATPTEQGETSTAARGPSEEQVFGIALESVNKLRAAVSAGKLTPNKTIDHILEGVEHVVSRNLVIPAFVLFQQERWADFIDIMLPNAPQDFKTECVRILIEEVEVDDGSGKTDSGSTALTLTP